MATIPHQESQTDVTISCLCAYHQHTYRITSPIPPLSFTACHCNSCRHSNGSLYNSALDWTFPLVHSSTLKATENAAEVDPPRDLVKYKFGPSLDCWYCATCSTKMYWRFKKPGSPLEIFPALLPDSFVERPDVNLKCKASILTLDTLDYGVTGWFPGGSSGEDRATMFTGTLDTTVMDLNDLRMKDRQYITPSGGKLTVACHCRGVQFSVHCPNHERFPVQLDSSEGTRLFSSNELMAWAIVPWTLLEFGRGFKLADAQDLRTRASSRQMGNLTLYNDKKHGAQRYFCCDCSACVFTVPLGEDNTSVRMAAGLLWSESGARAEDVLSWKAARAPPLSSRGVVYRMPPQVVARSGSHL